MWKFFKHINSWYKALNGLYSYRFISKKEGKKEENMLNEDDHTEFDN